MRSVLALSLLAAATAVVACAHEEKRLRAAPSNVETGFSPTAAPAQYLVADPLPARGGASVFSLGAPGVQGLVVEKRRLIVGQGEPRVAADNAPEPILGTDRIPIRFGGGFLFWTASSLYRTDAFDGALVPIASTPEPIDSVSFAPKALLVRTRNGERWGLGLPKGERVAAGPLGFADIQALDDGRAVTFDDQGAVSTSIDNGAHWTSATTQMRSAPSGLSTVAGELWLHEKNGGGWRVELDGHLAWFDKEPPEAAPLELRPKDPRWRGSEPPLRAVFRGGAALDDATGIVIESGDVVRVDLRTGELRSVVLGHLPPDAQCEALPVPGDLVFACISRAPGGGAFVVSHALSSEPPLIEQTFGAAGQFFGSDDGGLAFSGTCQGVAPPTAPIETVVCVRDANGHWEQHDVTGMTLDGGSSGDVRVARWVPRADGHAVALLTEPVLAIYDPLAVTVVPLGDDAREVLGARPLRGMHPPRARMKRNGATSAVIDGSWSYTSSGRLRGWQRHDNIEIGEDGKVTRSPYSFEVIAAGPNGLGRGKDGRLYQSQDHGATWIEVLAPPTGVEALDFVGCSTAGCDLGAFYRVGWQERPPRREPDRTEAKAPPQVRRTRGLELACRPSGAVTTKLLPRAADSPEDLGLGAARLPVANDRSDSTYVRASLPRGIMGPIHDHDVDDGEATPAYRGILSGYGTTRDGDVITVTGPNKNALALRRTLSYVPPFDPQGRVVRAAIALSDVVAAGRRIGLTTDEILGDDPTETGNLVPLVSLDPNAPSDVALNNTEHGLLSITRGERVRVTMRPAQNGGNIVSGVLLPNDEQAFLEVEPTAVGHVFKVGAGALAMDLFDVGLPADDVYYPANLDALAVGPKNELVILRTPSGSEPASLFDPAFVIAPAAAPVALAPWSEAKLADDPVCKADVGGYRAVVQTIGPWIRVTTPELRVEEVPALVRVRWTTTHACIEGFEVKLPPATVRLGGTAAGEPGLFATWLVAKGSTFVRLAISEGAEWRQPLECAIAN